MHKNTLPKSTLVKVQIFLKESQWETIEIGQFVVVKAKNHLPSLLQCFSFCFVFFGFFFSMWRRLLALPHPYLRQVTISTNFLAHTGEEYGGLKFIMKNWKICSEIYHTWCTKRMSIPIMCHLTAAELKYKTKRTEDRGVVVHDQYAFCHKDKFINQTLHKAKTKCLTRNSINRTS